MPSAKTSGVSQLRAAQDRLAARTPRIVTGPHQAWIETPEFERPYSPRAIAFVADVLAGKYKHERVGRFSPSSMGTCLRRTAFGFAGAPQMGEDPDSIDLMGLGTWGHLRWQAEGMSWPPERPYILDGEVWVHRPELLTGGSMDATLWDGSLFELKTAAFGKFRDVATANEPYEPHRVQVGVYFILSEALEDGPINDASIVYEERATGQFVEFRYERNERDDRAAAAMLQELGNHVADDTLPEMLPECEERRREGQFSKTPQWKICPFRKWCPKATKLKVLEAA